MTAVTHPDDLDVLPKRLAARFEVQRHVHDGWLTRTWEVLDRTNGERRALKLLHSHLATGSTRSGRVSRALGAYRASVALRHPAFATAYDLGPIAVEGGISAFFLTEYIDGQPLGALVEQGPLSLEASAHILLQVVEALEAASPHGPHLGLCPRNVFIQRVPKARVRITDHGLLLALHRDIPALAIDHGERSAWFSPEQLSGRQSGAQTDMWAIGALLRFSLTGSSPDTNIHPSALAPNVTRLVTWLMHPDPAERPDGFDAVRNQLQALARPAVMDGPTLRPTPEARVAAPPTRQPSLLVWTAVAVVLMGLAFTVAFS